MTAVSLLQPVPLLLVVAPLVEEVLFRLGLHEPLLQRLRASPGLANLLTALAFGGAHAAVQGDALGFATALPALAVGLVYQRWRRVRHCVALHAAMNGAWLAVGTLA